MPSWCLNHVTISTNDPQLSAQLRIALEKPQDLFGQFFPRPAQFDAEDKWYDWNMQNWGTKWDASTQKIQCHGDESTFELLTAWDPPVTFYERMEALGYEVNAFYFIEDFKMLGQFSNGQHKSFDFSDVKPQELEKELPSWAEPVFGVITNSSCEVQQINQKSELNSINSYPRTSWFLSTTMPVRNGLYEVLTENSDGELSLPRKLKWNQGKWDLNVYVACWRGLTKSYI